MIIQIKCQFKDVKLYDFFYLDSDPDYKYIKIPTLECEFEGIKKEFTAIRIWSYEYPHYMHRYTKVDDNASVTLSNDIQRCNKKVQDSVLWSCEE